MTSTACNLIVSILNANVPLPTSPSRYAILLLVLFALVILLTFGRLIHLLVEVYVAVSEIAMTDL